MSNLYQKLSKERKELQEKGEVPLHYVTAGYQLYKEKYAHGDETVRQCFERIAYAAHKHVVGNTSVKLKAYSKFYELLWKGWLSPATPVYNMGLDRGLPVSCSGGYVGDSIDSMYEHVKEQALLTKYGFGTSGYYGDIRPRGSDISTGGKSSGVLPIYKQVIDTMNFVSQGNMRRGSYSGSLPLSHGDFDEVIDHVHNNPDGANPAWLVYDKDVHKLKEGDTETTRRFQKALKTKMIVGRGYFTFPDKVNRRNPKHMPKFKASQLCVAPETLVLTNEGYRQIHEMQDETVMVWNGVEFSEVVVRKTGENQKLIKVVTNSGFELECTPYHKFYVAVRSPVSGNTKIIEKSASDLKKGDKLIKCNFPVIDGSEELPFAYENGFYTADGCVAPQGQRVYLYGVKRKLRDHLNDIFGKWTVQDAQDREYAHTDKLREKFFVPNDNFSVSSKVKWLEGFLDGDGVVCRNGDTQSIQATSIHKNFLLEVQMMLQTLGVSSKVTKLNEGGLRKLPANDGTGGYKDYYCQPAWRIMFGQSAITTLKDLGFSPKRLTITEHVANRECSQFVKIEDVVDTGRVDDTFCFTEHKRHMGVFNGILTGQCQEITLPSNEELTYSCVLSSMNVSKYDEWKDTDAVFWATVFLDCVASEFIEKAKNIKGLEKVVKYTEMYRSLGLGVCGFHTYLLKNNIPFESLQAFMFNKRLFKDIKAKAEQAADWMHENFGSYFPEHRRNSHLLALAPTKSTALLMGGISEGINPEPAMVYTQLTPAGEVKRINAVLYGIMKQRNKLSPDIIQDIVDHFGSVQHVGWLSDEEKELFRTAFEMNQEAVLRHASQRQPELCQAQSWNLYFPADTDPAWISHIHKLAFEDENILTMYYITTMAGVHASQKNYECLACQ